MNKARRQRKSFALIGVFALLCQLLLPALHAQAWASQNGDPMLVAFCGEVSPAFSQRYRETLPVELQRKLESAPHGLDKLSCSLCGAVHAAHLAGSPQAAPLVFGPASDSGSGIAVLAPPFVRLVVLPQLRAPPVS